MIPISLQFNGKHYSGHLSPVHGHGAQVYHLMIDGYYYGRLRFVGNEWIFDSNAGSLGWHLLAEEMGQVVVQWVG